MTTNLYSLWNINNCGAGTLGQEKRYMHINVHTLTHIYMRGGGIYNVIYIFTFVNHTLEIKTTWLIIVSKHI
jgi:hypothetical protein